MIPPVEAPWAVEFAALAKAYPTGWTGGRIHALRPLTLRLAPGRVLGLIGPNGSGKSTALKALAWLRKNLPGLPADDPAARRDVVLARIAALDRELGER